MKINYSKFDFNRVDIFGLIIGNITYLIYRFVITIFLKNRTKINFGKVKITINGLFMNKEIYYDDIKFISIRKNFLNSYDLAINLDESITIFRYLCNYISDSFSTGINKKNAFVICELKNTNEVLEELLKKIGFDLKELNSINQTIICSGKFNRKYNFLKFKNFQNKEIIKISKSNESIYVIDEFIKDDKNIILHNQSKNLLYKLVYKPMPVRYKLHKSNSKKSENKRNNEM